METRCSTARSSTSAYAFLISSEWYFTGVGISPVIISEASCSRARAAARWGS